MLGTKKPNVYQEQKECYVCKTTNNLHLHHIFFGVSDRKKSDKYKDICTIYLCAYHHNLSNKGVHFNKKLDLQIKQMAQKEFEKEYGKEMYMKTFKKNYL